MRNGGELDYSFIWISGGIFFLKYQFMEGDVLLGIMSFQLVRKWK